MDAYGCEAPQFMDFRNLDAPEDKASIEAYFERRNPEHLASPAVEVEDEVILVSDDDSDEDHEGNGGHLSFYTPMRHKPELQTEDRLSLSIGCLSELNDYKEEKSMENNISDAVKHLSITDNNDSAMNESNEPKKIANPRARSVKLTPRLNRSATLRARSNSGNRLPERFQLLAKPKDIQQSKYVSMQEAIKKFERCTPLRFHSKPKGTVCSMEKLNGPIACTIPLSPALVSRTRHRPVTAVSSVDLELKEAAEMKKFKIKANPVNRKVLEPLRPIQPMRKSPTQFVPFNITGAKKKDPTPVVVEPKEFHARPAPPNAPPRLGEVKRRIQTQPITPNVLKHGPPRIVQVEKPKEKLLEWTKERTNCKPFSFEMRDKMTLARKEIKWEKILEKERKMREFHSRPMPSKIYTETVTVKLTKKAESMESLKSNRSEDPVKPFKARPPVSLMKEPFIPKKSDRPLIEINQFDLNTEKRLRVRNEYDEMIREKERYYELERQMAEEAKRQEELEEVLRQRKKTVHIANPIKKFKELPVIEPRPCTIPATPSFISRQKDNKENVAQPMCDSYEE